MNTVGIVCDQEPWQLIINPVAGGGRAGSKHEALLGYLHQHDISYEAHLTQGPKHAREIVREVSIIGRHKFLIAGGDGTINEVVNGLFGGRALERQPVVVGIPVGTGNDWARNRGLNLPISELIKMIAEPTYRTCDIGRVSGKQDGCSWEHYFCNSIGIGLDVAVLENLPRWSMPAVRYAIGLLRAFSEFKAREVYVRADGVERRSTSLLDLCALAPYTGGGMRLAPHATGYPELLAITSVENVSWFRLLMSGYKIYNGTLDDVPEVTLYHAHTAEFLEPVGERLQVDGEIIGFTPVKVEILPQAVLTLASMRN